MMNPSHYPFAVTLRSMPGTRADLGRALERVAFFPGVSAAVIVRKTTDSITIGYRGSDCARAAQFEAQLAADQLVADAPTASHPADSASSMQWAAPLYCRSTWGGHFQRNDAQRRRAERNALRYVGVARSWL